MFKEVKLEARQFSDYQSIIEPKLYQEVLDLAAKLKGKRILEINATAQGGGVAEILHSQIGLEQDLGIDAHWWVLQGNDDFFHVTKMIHNALQGDKHAPTAEQWRIYDDINQKASAEIKASDWDYILVHDPQPAALHHFARGAEEAKWAWRCHIDSSFPNPSVGDKIGQYVADYDGAIFSLEQYLLPQLHGSQAAQHLGVIPVAIDPLSRKNRGLNHAQALEQVQAIGIDTQRPFIVQISRFDPWKDPLGVVKAWKLARQQVPGLQLVLMGEMASDDPEGAEVYALVQTAVQGLEDVHLITESNVLLVNALQQTAGVVLQKSLREGFGLTVSEALWASRPVIGGDVGGIPLQIQNGQDGYLVTTSEQAAEHIIELIKDPAKATAMGRAGHEWVRQNFLLPRLLRDQLAFWVGLA